MDCVKEKTDKNLDVFIFITKSLGKFLKKCILKILGDILSSYKSFINIKLKEPAYKYKYICIISMFCLLGSINSPLLYMNRILQFKMILEIHTLG